jgi:hypothetical protein
LTPLQKTLQQLVPALFLHSFPSWFEQRHEDDQSGPVNLLHGSSPGLFFGCPATATQSIGLPMLGVGRENPTIRLDEMIGDGVLWFGCVM